MDARLDYFADPTAGKALKHFMSVGTALKDSPLPSATQELVALRVSHDAEQLNALVILVAFMNTANRLNIITRQPAGAYEPGRFH